MNQDYGGQLRKREMILKLAGVTPEQLVQLHSVLKSSAVRLNRSYPWQEYAGSHGTIENAVSLVSAQFKDGTYSIVLKVLAEANVFTCRRGDGIDEVSTHGNVFPSSTILLSVFEALGLFPASETFVPNK